MRLCRSDELVQCVHRRAMSRPRRINIVGHGVLGRFLTTACQLSTSRFEAANWSHDRIRQPACKGAALIASTAPSSAWMHACNQPANVRIASVSGRDFRRVSQ